MQPNVLSLPSLKEQFRDFLSGKELQLVDDSSQAAFDEEALLRSLGVAVESSGGSSGSQMKVALRAPGMVD
ncbi:hypothetical protein AK812_SmicGene5236 [Symbiodinium microadriaticum]|uniref:Uncharacterized protein n=1 Tax=Symbiodinium microadriaticum TaxID=2951 RepID=A0A1Q9EUE7_SYMMI|nr:hypothetical protein AK812_SmicGene5236 [Symbiodinium microadriaticum]